MEQLLSTFKYVHINNRIICVFAIHAKVIIAIR